MKTTPNKTIDYYQSHTDEFVQQTINVDMREIYEAFMKQLQQQELQHILDVGCGSGRDSVYFISLGYQVTAIDASANLIRWASEYYNSETINWYCMTFDQIKDRLPNHRFSGIWACASLLHVSFDNLSTTFNSLLALLNDNGVLYASFKYGDSERYENSRFFCDVNEERWGKVKSQLVFSVKDKVWISEDKRSHRDQKWLNVIIRKH